MYAYMYERVCMYACICMYVCLFVCMYQVDKLKMTWKTKSDYVCMHVCMYVCV